MKGKNLDKTLLDIKTKTDTAQALLVFGATGDLAQRMLLPSLYGLHCDGLLPPGLGVIGSSRSALEASAFRARVAESLARYLPAERLADANVQAFLSRLQYVPVNVAEGGGFAALQAALGEQGGTGKLAIFLSTAPSLFSAAINGLREAGLAHEGVRLALEKPLGHDLHSSQAINDAVLDAFPEERTFRIDHYLGKETVQNLLALRFGNQLFEPLWNAAAIDHVQITVAETVGLEGRIDFYDGMGALRDMVQNHMLQLLALVAMEPPAKYDAAAVRDEKVKVLRSLRPIDQAMVTTHSVLGQYGPGAVGGAPVLGYADELGATTSTETFVALKAHVDNWRWKGVPFYLRTGKRLPVRQSEILVQFKPVPHSIFDERSGGLVANKLLIKLQPEENIRLLVMVKEPGLGRNVRLREVPLDLSLSAAFAGQRQRIAYERLLLDFINGDPTLFVRRDEVEAQWQWIDAIRDGWAYHGMTPKRYTAGSWGPSSAIALTERDGVSWHD